MTHIARTVILLGALLLMAACGGAAAPEPAPTGDVETAPRMTATNEITTSQEQAPLSNTESPALTSTQVPSRSGEAKRSPANALHATGKPDTTASTPTAVESERLVPTPSRGGNGIVPISEEQARQELRKAGVLTTGWKTNFTLRSIDYGDLFSGGPGKDGIPAIDAPKFETVAEADEWLDEREPVQVVNLNGDARAYPMQIMMWHEVVNDTVGGEPVVITY